MTDEELLWIIQNAAEMNETYLDLRDNRLIDVLPEIARLTHLTELYLSQNTLNDLRPELFQLTNLTELHLSDNQMSELPAEICQLTDLQELYLGRNMLTELPSELFLLSDLTVLHLNDNQINELSPDICQLSNLEELRLDGNPLTSPPLEIAEKGIEAIRQYFEALKQEQEEKFLNEAKIILIGEGAAGKTSLTKRIASNDFDPHEPTTHGIRITPWEPDTGNQPVKVNIWDFGGQDIMHATHQFFLSKRSLYVLVLDGRRDEEAEYWLRHVSSFGGESPVLIVLNKQDEACGFDLNRTFLLRKYSAVKGFYSTSCKKNEGIDEFREALLNELVQIEMLETRWPGSWFRVKKRLEEMEEPYISCDEYESFCAEEGITEQISQEVLVEFLNDLGVAVHFKGLDLDDTHVLNPLWLTNGVYRIITATEVVRQGGILHEDSLRDIFKSQNGEEYSYPRSRHKYLLSLMREFKLCYDLDSKRVLIPQLLPVTEPDVAFDEANSLSFILHYPHFLPRSIMPRFIVRMHKDIKNNLRWRTGVVLENKDFGATAMIRADNETRRISIFVNGNQRKDYFAAILLFFREINADFKRLDVRELVPMPDEPEVTARYSTLLKHAERDMDEYLPDDSDKVYSVKELLGLVQPDREDQVLELLRMIKAQLDEKESGAEVFNSLFKLEPSILGIGINLNEAFKRILATQKGKRRS